VRIALPLSFKPERFAVSSFPFGVLFMRNSPESRQLAVLLPESLLLKKAIFKGFLLRRLDLSDLSR